jgi:nucleoside-diphosphate-sugar epimerase
MGAKGVIELKALVTGGTGFIGTQVVDRLLEARHFVRVLSRKRTSAERWKNDHVETVQGDLEVPETVVSAMKGTDIFYHIGEIKNTTKAASERNMKLMKRIIEEVGSSGVKRIVFVSSLTVAGIPSETPANEETLPETVLTDHYTSYKRECERLLAGNTGGFEYAVIRPAPVYGPGSRYLGRLIAAVEKFGPIGLPFAGNARNKAPLIHVKDLAKAIYLSGVSATASGQVFNLTDGFDHSWRDFLACIAECLGRRLRIIPLPPALLKMPAVPLDLISGFLGFEIDPLHYLDYFSKDIFFNNAKAREFLDWKPEYALAAGVRDMTDSYTGKGRAQYRERKK